MELRRSRLREFLVLHAAGRIDHQTGAEFQEGLLSALAETEQDLILDLASVEYISSAGLSALMTASRRKPRDRRIGVAGLNEVVQEIFAISRFHRIFPVFHSVEAAVQAWGDADGATGELAPFGVRFWGTRGSLPAPVGEGGVRAKIREALLIAHKLGTPAPEAIETFIDQKLPFSVRGTFGGNTSCVEIITGGEEHILCDLGTGVREFGNNVMAQGGPGAKACYNIFMSHLHWDHIMGFPFFTPAYIPGNTIRIHGCHKGLRDAMARQQSGPYFPVNFEALGAAIEFVELEPGSEYLVGGLSVSAIKQFHSGDSYGYRFARDGKVIVYSTDCEHKTGSIDESYPFIEFYRDADLLVFDAMYSLADTISVKEDWGHSSNIVAVELAQMAGVKRLVMFHHEPAFNDGMIERVLGETIRFEELSRAGNKVEVFSAYDGQEILL